VQKGYETRFVKLKLLNGDVHSVAEVKAPDGWYIADIDGNMGIFKGEFVPGQEINGCRLWKKGRDAWDIGLWGSDSLMDGKVID